MLPPVSDSAFSASPRGQARSIILVANELNSLGSSGGIGTSNWLLAQLLAKHDWKVHILHCGNRPPPTALRRVREALQQSGIGLTDLEELPMPSALQLAADSDPHAQKSERVRRALDLLAQTFPFDLAQFAEWQGLGFRTVQAKRAGTGFGDAGIILKLHSMSQWMRCKNHVRLSSPAQLMLDFYERHSFEEADFQIAVSHSFLEYTRSIAWKVRDDVQIVANPLAQPELLATPSDEHPPELVFFGRLEVRKGLLIFLDALAEIDPALPVTFLGEDTILPAGVRASQLIESRLPGRKVTLLHGKNRAEALDYLSREHRLAVIPSLDETFCHAAAECIVHGIPFLASRVGAIPEFVSDPDLQHHLLFQPQVNDLALCLNHYLHAPAYQRRQWREKARTGARIEPHNRRIVEFYEACLDKVRAMRSHSRPAARARIAPLVTVAVTHFNLGAFLPQALASLANQTHRPCEVLVLDDGSTDPASRQVVAEQEERYPQFRFIGQPNSGVSAARNRLLAEARGEFFLPFDADNVAMPNLIECLLSALTQNPDHAVMASYNLQFDEDFDPAFGPYRGAFRPSGGPHLLACLGHVYGDGCGLYRTAALRAVGGYDPNSANEFEDQHLYVRLVNQGYRVGLVPEYLFYYRVRPSSRCRRADDYRSRQFILNEFVREATLSEADRIALWSVLAGWSQQPHQTFPVVALPSPLPLRYRLADRVNRWLRRIPLVHRASKRTVQAAWNLWKASAAGADPLSLPEIAQRRTA